MSLNHVVVWIDHVVAHIQHFDADTSVLKDVISHSMQPHLHIKSGIIGSGRSSENIAYFDEVAAALSSARAILIVGPASEKYEFQKHLIKAHPPIAKMIVAVETVDHPTDGQMLHYARKYFTHADRMQSTQ